MPKVFQWRESWEKPNFLLNQLKLQQTRSTKKVKKKKDMDLLKRIFQKLMKT